MFQKSTTVIFAIKEDLSSVCRPTETAGQYICTWQTSAMLNQLDVGAWEVYGGTFIYYRFHEVTLEDWFKDDMERLSKVTSPITDSNMNLVRRNYTILQFRLLIKMWSTSLLLVYLMRQRSEILFLKLLIINSEILYTVLYWIYYVAHIQSVPGGMCQTSGGCSLC
jgi:hypothetical protein